MKRTAALVMAAWTAAATVNAQVMRFDWDNGNRRGDSIREQLRGQPVPASPHGRDVERDRRGRDETGGEREAEEHGDWGRRRGQKMRGRPERWDGGGVRALAHRIETDTEKLRHDYAEVSRTGNFLKKLSRQQGLNALSILNDAARRYHRELESRWSDPWETRENFRDLVRALDAAEDTMPTVTKGGSVRAQLGRVSDAVEDLIRYYRWEDRRDGVGWRRERCEGVNFWGKWYEGGGCDINGCWTAGGGCGHHGCWSDGGGCNFHGCWRRGGNCGFHGCVGQVPSVGSQPCVE